MSISYSGNKIFSFYNDAKKLIKGNMVNPRFVSLWLTTVCDLKCGFCFFGNENQHKIFADTKSVISFIDQISNIGVESLEFSGGGEPTIHPDFGKIVLYAHSKGLKLGLLTNGFKLDWEVLKYFDYVRIGLDAHNSTIYAQIKGSTEKRFDHTISNLQKLLFNRTASQKHRPRIGLKFMINTINYIYLERMVKFAKEQNVDYCHFKSTHNDQNGITDNYTDTFIQKLEDDITKLKSKYPDFVYGSLLFIKACVKCFMSPIHTVITPEGNLLICCYFTDDAHIVGNVFSSQFETVWNSPRHQEIINSIQISDCAKVDCRWNTYNKEMTDILIDSKHDLAFI